MHWQTIFINPHRHVLRSGWRVVVFVVLLSVGTRLFQFVAALLLSGGQMTEGRAAWMTPGGLMIQYLLLIAATLIASLVCLRSFDRLRLRSLGYQLHAGWWRDYLIGAGMAAAMITAVVGFEWLTGTISLTWSEASINGLLYGLAVSFVFFHVAAAFEELVLRGYPLQTLLRDLHPAWAVFITSTLFGLLHMGNPNATMLGILNTVLAGVWLAVAYLKTRSLWLCTSLHWSWNWAMNAVYGLNVSGLEGVVRNPLMNAETTGPGWLTGGSYGPEGGLLTTIVVILSTLVLWRAHWLAPSPEVIAALQSDRAEAVALLENRSEVDLRIDQSPEESRDLTL